MARLGYLAGGAFWWLRAQSHQPLPEKTACLTLSLLPVLAVQLFLLPQQFLAGYPPFVNKMQRHYISQLILDKTRALS
jgi:hypothetical protein